ncbi:MAG TPA: hypothetical protein VKU01_15245 [Bryobacteraceae bacterium]|nr:hypothetical protein [Bryobacteraceae bacterium]
MMNSLRILCLLAVALSFATDLAAQNGSDETRDRVLGKVDEIERALREHPFNTADFPNFPKTAGTLIESIRDLTRRGYLYPGLEKIGQLITVAHATRYAEERSAELGPGFPPFDAEWTKVNQRVVKAEQELGATNWTHRAPAQRALIETARSRMGQFLSAGRGFAVHDDTFSGLFWLGQAEGQAEFARFCSSLNLPEKSPAKAHSVLPELQSLQEKAVAAFVPPKSIDLHPQFIVLNSLLKTGFEMDAERSYAGSLYRYLDAVEAYRLLDGVDVDAEQKAILKQKVASLRNEFNASRERTSVAEIFLERAEALANASSPTAVDWRNVEAIIEYALPAFSAQPPPLAARHISRKAVRLTLVRWPFT